LIFDEVTDKNMLAPFLWPTVYIGAPSHWLVLDTPEVISKVWLRLYLEFGVFVDLADKRDYISLCALWQRWRFLWYENECGYSCCKQSIIMAREFMVQILPFKVGRSICGCAVCVL